MLAWRANNTNSKAEPATAPTRNGPTNGGKAGQHHHAHPHIQAALQARHAAEKMMAAGHVGKAEKDFHKASVQIQDTIKAHQQHHHKK